MMVTGRHILTVMVLNGKHNSAPAELLLKKNTIKYPPIHIRKDHSKGRFIAAFCFAVSGSNFQLYHFFIIRLKSIVTITCQYHVKKMLAWQFGRTASFVEDSSIHLRICIEITGWVVHAYMPVYYFAGVNWGNPLGYAKDLAVTPKMAKQHQWGL